MASRTLVDVALERDCSGMESGIISACWGTVALKYRRIGERVILLEPVRFKKGKMFFPDEELMVYLISMIARSQIVIWSKDVQFLDRQDLHNCTSLDCGQIAVWAKELDIDPGNFNWYKVADTPPIQILARA